MADTRLKNCPFCGGEAEAVTLDYEYVRCDKCHFGIARLTIDEAIAAWNRRTPPAASDALSTLIYESVRFAIWACGEGISPAAGEPAADPEEFVYAYVFATGDEDLDTLPGRASAYRTSPPAAVPDGWEPTPDMVGAARSVVRQILVDAAYEFRADRRKSSAMFAAEVLVSNAMANAIKAAMLAAAPAAPNGWQPIETAPKDRPIAIEYKSGSGWKVTGAQWNKYKRLWETPLVTLLPHEIARWHELPNGLDNPDAKSPAENSDD